MGSLDNSKPIMKIRDIALIFSKINDHISNNQSSFKIDSFPDISHLLENEANLSFGNLLIKGNVKNAAKAKLDRYLLKRNMISKSKKRH